MHSLKENLEFCEILKRKISFGKGKLWLMCNGRPLYLEYENGKIKMELNGWGWLKKTEYWSELERCDFYEFRDSELIFYCPEIEENYPYFWKGAKAKIYSFNKNKFSIKKAGERDFFEIVLEDLQESYQVLKDCRFLKTEVKGGIGYKPIFLFEFQCDNLKLITETNLHFSFPPIDFDNPEESLKKTLHQVSDVSTKENEICGKLSNSTLCLSRRMTMKIFIGAKVDDVIKDILFLIFPKKELAEIKLLKEEPFVTQEVLPVEMAGLKFRYYKVGEEVIKVYLTDQIIFGLERIGKGFFQYESF